VEQLEDASEVYYDYVCRSLSFGVPHPSEIAEPRGLSTISLPEPTYPLRDALDKCNIIDTGKLSSLQLEGVQYACQRHQLMLAGGTRAGFFLGDGAGVGKGRQIAGWVRNAVYEQASERAGAGRCGRGHMRPSHCDVSLWACVAQLCVQIACARVCRHDRRQSGAREKAARLAVDEQRFAAGRGARHAGPWTALQDHRRLPRP